MDGVWIMIIASILSRICFSLLFSRVEFLFVSIKNDLNKLSSTTRFILRFLGQVLSISITILIGIRFAVSYAVVGLILGLCTALVDMCFDNNPKSIAK